MSRPENGIPEWDRARLEQGLQTCDSRALIAFYSHFRPILTERARLFGIPPADHADAVETFLGDMLLSLCAGGELPRSLHAYVFVSFKRYAARLKSANKVDRDSIEELSTELLQAVAVSPDSAVAQPGNDSLARFASALLADLSSEERLIIGSKAEEMPLREIAVLLNVKYNAANTRLCRLRSRLQDAAPGIVSRMDARDRKIVERFLRRARPGQWSNAALRVAEQSRSGAQRRLNDV